MAGPKTGEKHHPEPQWFPLLPDKPGYYWMVRVEEGKRKALMVQVYMDYECDDSGPWVHLRPEGDPDQTGDWLYDTMKQDDLLGEAYGPLLPPPFLTAET